MEDSSSRRSLEDRLRDALDNLDNMSKKASKSIGEKLQSTKQGFDDRSEKIGTKEMLNKAKEGVSSLNSRLSTSLSEAQLGNKVSSISKIASTGLIYARSIFYKLASYSPYLIPSVILFQSAIWVSYLSEGTLSNSIVSEFEGGMGEAARASWIVTSVFGASLAFLLMINLDSNTNALVIEASSSTFDIVPVLLLVSSVLFLLKSHKSLYYLSLSFIGSVVIRLSSINTESYNILAILLCSLCLFGAFSAFSITFLKRRFQSNSGGISEKVEIEDSIDVSEILSHEFSEDSYLTPFLVEFDYNMDNAPINPPKRPSRRSEYELYEWVGLLANIVLWPTTLAISMLLGSGYEIDGTALSMEDNYMMLLGPAIMTAFFFFMQFRMDSSARDGTLYAAQKQAYLDEMEKYVEAKKAYLELVTLQAQIKKEQLIEENPGVRSNPVEN